MCSCGARKKKDSRSEYTALTKSELIAQLNELEEDIRSIYTALTESELIARQTELEEDLKCAVAEAVVYGSTSTGILVGGACTGTIPLLLPGVVATTISAGVSTARVIKIEKRLEAIREALLYRRKLS